MQRCGADFSIERAAESRNFDLKRISEGSDSRLRLNHRTSSFGVLPILSDEQYKWKHLSLSSEIQIWTIQRSAGLLTMHGF